MSFTRWLKHTSLCDARMGEVMNSSHVLSRVEAKSNEFFVLNWNLGKRCNFACSYCPTDLHDDTSPHLSLDEMTAAFCDVIAAKKDADDTRKMRVEFTGGEPTANPAFLPFLAWLRANADDHIAILGVTTNGSRPYGYYRDLLTVADYITFSAHFEYMNEPHFMANVLLVSRLARSDSERVRKVSVNLMDEPWASERVAQMLTVLKKETVCVRLTRVRNHYLSLGLEPKFKDRFDYDHFVIENGAPNQASHCEGDAVPDRSSKSVGRSVLGPEEDSLAGTQGYVSAHTSDGICFTELPSSLIDDGLNNFLGWVCHTGEQGIHIYNDGTVYGSVCRAVVLGSLREGFILAPTPIACPFKSCLCSSDIRILKYRVS
jgi:organic radical activating enzyme